MKIRTHGDAGAPTVLCLHPLACAGDLWDRFALFLVGRGFRVLAPDLPAEVAQDGLTVAAMAESVVRAVESDCPVSIVALSMGGCVALQLAIDHPELVDKLVLADTTANYGPDRVAKWEQRAEYAVSVPRTDQLDFQIPRWFTPDFVARDPDECTRIADIFVRTDSEVHAACCRALGAFDVLDRLDSVRAETLVLVGEQDQATPPEMARPLAAGIKGAQLVTLPQAGHFSLVQGGHAWDVIGEFLAR